MKTSLFNEETESYTIEANNIANEFDKAIRAIFQKYSSQYYVRELEVIAMTAVNMAGCNSIMDQQYERNEKHKAEIAVNLSDPNLADRVRCQVKFNERGSKIATIKVLRQLAGMSLAAAKKWVEENMSEFHHDNWG